MSTLKKLKKLRRMPPGELAGRAAGHWGIQRLKWLARDPSKMTRPGAAARDPVIAACRDLVPGTNRDELQQLAERSPEEFQAMSGRAGELAETVAAGRYQLLGQPVRVDQPIDWHADPVTGHRWEDVIFSRVSYHRIPEHVDFKHIWELGRHQFLVELTRSWLLNGNESHLELARGILGSWLQQNRFAHGIHWTSGLEVAMRSISWIWMIANAPSLLDDDELAEHWIGELFLHGYYLENHLSVYSSPYNHVIGEATGLYLLGTLFHPSPHGHRWRGKGRQLLQTFGPRQFYEDGFCVEQAVGYHYFTLGFLTLALTAGQATNDQALGLRDLIQQGYQAGLLFRQPDGNWPAIGDVDSASAIPVARGDFWNFSPLHQAAAAALRAPAIHCEGDCSWGETYWLLGTEGMARLNTMGIPNERNQVAALPMSGYFIAAKNDDWLLLDAGPIAHGLHSDATHSVAHGHADTLQLLLHWDGKPVFIDSGMPNYAGNLERSDYFRSPAAHNAIGFDRTSLVRHAGRLAWSHDVASTQLRWSNDAECWQACGEVRWDDCKIRRHLLAIPGEAVWIADWLESSKPQAATWQWQLRSQDWKQRLRDSHCVEFRQGSLQLQTTVASDGLEFRYVHPDGDRDAGWVSPGYGILVEAGTLQFQLPVVGQSLIMTVVGRPTRRLGFQVDGEEITAGLTEVMEPPSGVTEGGEGKIDSFGMGCWSVVEER